MGSYYAPYFYIPWKWRDLSCWKAEQKRLNRRKKQRRARCGRKRK